VVISYPSFGTNFRYHLQGWPTGCAETSARNYHNSLGNNPEERSSQLLRGGGLKSYEGVSKIFLTDAVKIIKLTTKRVWKLPTSTQLRATWHTDSIDMVVLTSKGASRYHNCCIDGGTSPSYFGYTLVRMSVFILQIGRWFSSLLTPRSDILLETLTVPQAFKKFPAFYGTRRSITCSQEHATCPHSASDRSIHALPPYLTPIFI
jgi:hypothetical protein